jgi:hypothetical protein
MGESEVDRLNSLLTNYIETLSEGLEELRQKYCTEDGDFKDAPSDSGYQAMETDGANFLVSMVSAVVAKAIERNPGMMIAVSMAPDSLSAFGIIAKYGVEVGLLMGLALQTGELDGMVASATKFLEVNEKGMADASEEFNENMKLMIAGMMGGGDDGEVFH